MARSYRKLIGKVARESWGGAFGSGGPLAAGPPKPAPFVPQADPTSLNFADPTYVGALAQGNLPFEQALARLPGDVGSLASQYGYQTNLTPGQVDPNTGLAQDPNIQVTGIDTSNPYSRAALLQRSYDQTKAGNTTGYGARGQLYSGALQNAQGAATQNFNTSSDQLRGSFNDIIHGWLNNLGGARLAASAARTGALGALTQQSADNPAPTTYGGVPYAPDQSGLLTPLAGAKPTAASVMASGSLAGTGAAGSGKVSKLRPGDAGYKKPRRK